MKLPKKYVYLQDLVLPWVIEQGLKEYGTWEWGKAENNPKILGWADEVAAAAPSNYNKWVGSWYDKDSIPWCGLYAAVIALRAKKEIPNNYLRAMAWANFGKGIDEDNAGLGDVLVFYRNGGGHVGFYVGEDKTHYHILGGNQGDQVNIRRIAKSRIYSVNRPIYNNQPASVKKYWLSADGKVSTNEA